MEVNYPSMFLPRAGAKITHVTLPCTLCRTPDNYRSNGTKNPVCWECDIKVCEECKKEGIGYYELLGYLFSVHHTSEYLLEERPHKKRRFNA